VNIVSVTFYNSAWATPETAVMGKGQSISLGLKNNVNVKLRVLLRILLS
jgi:hypothetical protein